MRFGMGNRNCKIWFESSTGAAWIKWATGYFFFSLWQQKQTLQTDTLLNLLADAFQQIKSNIIIHLDLLCCASGHLIDVLNAMSDSLAAECFTFALLLSAGLGFLVFQSFVLGFFWGGGGCFFEGECWCFGLRPVAVFVLLRSLNRVTGEPNVMCFDRPRLQVAAWNTCKLNPSQ